jgi:hypothetical protein
MSSRPGQQRAIPRYKKTSCTGAARVQFRLSGGKEWPVRNEY